MRQVKRGFRTAAAVASGTAAAVAVAVAALCALLSGCGNVFSDAVAAKAGMLRGIVLDRSELTLSGVGSSMTLTATTTPDSEVANTVRWCSDDTAIATVDGGEVTALRLGGTTVRAIVGACGGSCAVRIVPVGKATTFAGSAGSSGNNDGTGSAARFYCPMGITSDGTSLYVSDTNSTIRRIDIASAEVTTLAGSADSRGSADGTGSAARFYNPLGITSVGTSLYVTDTCNHTIRRIDIASAEVTTLVGGAGNRGSADGTGSAARFDTPSGITSDGTSLYVADQGNNMIRRIDIASAEVTTLAGSADSRGSADGTGSAARFDTPSGITSDGTSLYVAEYENHTIRRIDIATGTVTTLAGSAGSSGSADGTGSAARFYHPIEITSDGTSLYIVDMDNFTIRRIDIATRTVTTLAGSAGDYSSADGTGSAAKFMRPAAITSDGTSLYVAEADSRTIRRID